MVFRYAWRAASRLGLPWIVAGAILAGCGSVPAQTAQTIKLAVDEDALYEVGAAALAEAGFDLAAAAKDELSLTAGGTNVPFELAGQGKVLALRFQGLRLAPDAYSPRNVYWLRRSADQVAAAPPQPAPTATPVVQGPHAVTLRLEKDLQYDTLAELAADRWYWENIFAPATVNIPFALRQVDTGEGELRLYVIARSSAPVDPDHRLAVFINDTLVTDAPWDGLGPRLITAPIPAGVLKDGENKMAVTAPGDTGAPADLVQLHWIEINYPTNGTAGEQAPREVAAISPARYSGLPDWEGGADLVIVTVPEFRDALKPLVEARQKQGLRVAMLDAEQVYDAFSHGRTDPAGIQALMRYAREKWVAPAPRFLLLAGDASYDTLGQIKGTELDIIPTQTVRTTFSGWTGSDVWYALPDDGSTTLPAFSVGRFPAQTAEQIAIMVRKTLAHEAETGNLDWRSKALLVADNDEPGFAEETAAFAAGLAHFASERITIDGDGANASEALNRAFQEGTGLIGYFGHGSIPLWAKENVFDVEDAARLRNERLPIVFTVTCLSGFFEHPATPSLGEVLLRQEQGGAVAALVPSSAAVLTDQRLLANGLAEAIAASRERSIGEIVLDAQRSLPQQEGGVREILLTFNLLGDPSMTLRR